MDRTPLRSNKGRPCPFQGIDNGRRIINVIINVIGMNHAVFGP
jgi:hypothetical protein